MAPKENVAQENRHLLGLLSLKRCRFRIMKLIYLCTWLCDFVLQQFLHWVIKHNIAPLLRSEGSMQKPFDYIDFLNFLGSCPFIMRRSPWWCL